MTCLDDRAVLAFARGQLADDALSAAAEHVDTCRDCRLAVAAAAGSRPVAEPASIGRFAIEAIAGRGAMGIVYRARDPRLDRPVALKLIRPEALAQVTRGRFEREARALARVNHPNVVSIYEVGDADGSVYIAMEYVDGGTLADWLAAEPRSAAAIAAVMVQAGEGLAAAHRAGLVHRDFKPTNVLVDTDGRARVTDFGLAHDGDEVDRGTGAQIDADALVTQTGMVVGTPAYMAPEQHAAQLADPRSDQFAFCVTLFEAIAGHRPFDANDYTGLVEAVRSGRIRAPARPIPRAIHRAIRRGLARDPADRFATMETLLRAIDADRRARRNAGVAALAILALVAGGAAGIATLRGERSASSAGAACADVDDRWRQLFDERGAGAFPVLEPDEAPPIFEEMERLGADWIARYLDTCGPGVTPALAKARRLCLDDALARAGETIQAPLGTGGAGQARQVLVEARAHLDRCTSAELASLSMPADDALERVARARERLAESAGHRYAGRHAEAIRAADDSIALARDADYAPVLAEAWLEKARAQRRQGDASASIESSHRAVGFAQQSGHYAVLRSAAENLAWQYYFGAGDADQARRWVDSAERLDGKARPTDYELALRNIVRAHVDEAGGKRDDAIARLESVERLARRGVLGADIGVRALEGAVIMLYRARRWDDVPPLLDRLERDYRDHRRAQYVAARHRGELLVFAGRAADSAEHFERAAALATSPRDQADALLVLGDARAAAGDVEGAEASWQRAVAAYGEGDVPVRAVCARAKLAQDTERWDVAAEAMGRCLGAREQRLDANQPVLIYTLVSLGQIHYRRGETTLAVDYMERALARFDAIGRSDDGVNAVRWTLAQMLDRTDRARSLELAAVAARNLAETQPQLAETIRRWVAARKN